MDARHDTLIAAAEAMRAALPSALAPGERVFLMLQGPHGPFFDRLGRMLRAAGAEVWRAGFNAGDEWFWSDRDRYIPHTGTAEDWPAHLDALIDRLGVTDLVLYGDVRPVHAAARAAAEARDLTLHVFEEGYLRPFWITYERGGSNGHSRLMEIDLSEMLRSMRGREGEMTRPPARWGDMRQHKFYGALYHALVLTANRRYRGFRSHRSVSVLQEFRLHLRRVLLTPWLMLARSAAAARVRHGGFPYVLVLMQLEHDASFQAHSDYTRMAEFTDAVMEAFAEAAPRHHHLVFKAHPLEDNRGRVRAAILRRAARLGIRERVHYIHGGKLARLVAQARSAITVNSTAAQQALWRGVPVLALGRAVYDKPGLVSHQPLTEFLREPERPAARRYRTYRDYLLETSQVPGGFYARHSRAAALRLVVDMMLAPLDPYDSLSASGGTYRQQPGGDDG
ncbi:capsule biosynthesis protein CapA [Paracoccus sp. S-4012]|uniref:capsule biosynthesis protein n=1 Tax=Paracoccus sp. S-4012 TaxID=2665648 RepID=UPI0012B091E3|nr:capsule biosynthesis protein CapA [Paracoccus sp. S-4012]MRX51311.1 capsule biosynthesis protein CapA [Paracoccus sp. S-4012]